MVTLVCLITHSATFRRLHVDHPTALQYQVDAVEQDHSRSSETRLTDEVPSIPISESTQERYQIAVCEVRAEALHALRLYLGQ